MYDFVIIGTGNVAFHLVNHFVTQGKSVCVIGRNKIELQSFERLFEVQTFSSICNIPDFSIVFLCVPDKVVYELEVKISSTCSLIYTAGSVSLKKSKRDNLGVFYPLQTFSKNRKINFKEIPILVEASNKLFEHKIGSIASIFSDNVQYIDSETRLKIHLTAVICNNFTNYLINFAQNFVEKEAIDFKLFEPLLKETIDKAVEVGAEQAQTGPAKRNDIDTITKHLELLNNTEKVLYLTITNNILAKNGYKKL